MLVTEAAEPDPPAVVPVADLAPAKEPPETVDAHSGVYRVRGPGSVIFHRRNYAPGDTIVLEPHEARDLAAHITR